ncbi:hypothetical protein [Aeromicrobium chenweiae]|uniref:hypothetical protein n=1 Tax=Aeromicrobium chenweiae TaxID=2079793 RepID=UPI0019024775|nr:hypothetical protein [Aeromicrobium chenweiae]
MTIHDESLRDLRRGWGSLADPRLTDLTGTFEASYVGAPLRTIAPRGLAIVGLPRWFGKRFIASGIDPARLDGVNLLRSGGGLTETLPMTAALGPSLADGRPALLVTYPRDAPRPWRWVRDEFRPWDDHTLLGMTFVDLAGLRRAPGTPFVLSRSVGR